MPGACASYVETPNRASSPTSQTATSTHRGDIIYVTSKKNNDN